MTAANRKRLAALMAAARKRLKAEYATPAYTDCPNCGRTDHRWLPCDCACHEPELGEL